MSSIPLHRLLSAFTDTTRLNGEEIGEAIKDYDELLDFFPNSQQDALIDPTGTRMNLTHERLRTFLKHSFDLRNFKIPYGTRVAIVLPNGPEIAVCLLGVLSHWCAVPISATFHTAELITDFRSCLVKVLICSADNHAAIAAAEALSIGVLTISPSLTNCGLFEITERVPVTDDVSLMGYTYIKSTKKSKQKTYNHSEIAMILQTSGTSGNKKVVPYSLDTIVIGTACIATTWQLRPDDICLNMMPLFHIGGIARNVLSPILSGGSVITCSGFDAGLFWDILFMKPFTWYYAAPTMHHAILQEGERRQKPLPVSSVRFIANAAGALLPVLAASLKATFDCTILTSYGMSECMPISSPPQHYALDPIGTSGMACGPQIIICDEDTNQRLPIGAVGNIFIRGPPLFHGYEGNESSTDESFFEIDGQAGWFNTGDCGRLDEQGYLFITGRSKEIINKGGETISPFEIEEVVMQHPFVRETLAFSAPHETLQETIGAVIVTRAGCPRVDLPSLHAYLRDKLDRSKWPQLIVYMQALPKNAAGKVLRIKLADRLGLPNVDDSAAPHLRLLEATCPPVGTPLTEKIPYHPVIRSSSEAEGLLRAYPGVREVVILSMAVSSVKDAFVAVVAPDSLSAAEIENALQASQIDRVNLPFAVAALDAAVLTKTARQDLERIVTKVIFESSCVSPRNSLEKRLEAIFRAELELEKVCVTRSFFELGGDSLKAGRLMAVIRKKFKAQLFVADLYDLQSIEKIAQRLDTTTAAALSLSYTSLSTGQGDGDETMSPLQKSRSQVSLFESRVFQKLPTEETLSEKTASKSLSLSFDGEDEKGASRKEKPKDVDEEDEDEDTTEFDITSVLSSTSTNALIVQLIPLLILHPLRNLLSFFVVIYIWLAYMTYVFGQGLTGQRFISLLFALSTAPLITSSIYPFIGIIAKWVIIGRYKPGKYPLFGTMYLKWWFTDRMLEIFGKGIFAYDVPYFGSALHLLYYRMLGMKIGKNVKISKDAVLSHYDLITVGDGAVLDKCQARPASMEEGHLLLLPIYVGDGASVGFKSTLAPGAEVPGGTHIGPLSSSYEMGDAKASNKRLNRQLVPGPPTYLVACLGVPLFALIHVISMIPWVLVVYVMVTEAKQGGWAPSELTTVFDIIEWWTTPYRMCFFLATRVAKLVVAPTIKFFLGVIVKRNLIGKFQELEGDAFLDPWVRFKYWLMPKLIKSTDFNGVTKLVGTHYEPVSMIYRMLGAKIGKRVYWPGSGLDIVEYDLLEIGDDVVFGSRSAVFTSLSDRSARVTVESGCMVADRCLLVAGATLRRGAVLGSGGMAPENAELPMGSVWVGSVNGAADMVSGEDRSVLSKDLTSPYGRAFCRRQANYYVWPLSFIIFYSTSWASFCAIYKRVGVVLSLYIARLIGALQLRQYDRGEVFFACLLCCIPVFAVLTLLAMSIDISAKWLVMGRRKKGTYTWESSSYCQRWQIYLVVQQIRTLGASSTILSHLQGSFYLVQYFRWLGCQIGENVCLYPNGGDPMMTEPDLVEIQDNACVDDASLIAHFNTKGQFSLNPLKVGRGCVLKSNSRLLSGATMGPNSILLEHTLVMAGDTIDAAAVWQGWPMKTYLPLRSYRMQINRSITYFKTEDRLLARRRSVGARLSRAFSSRSRVREESLRVRASDDLGVALVDMEGGDQHHGFEVCTL